MQVANIHVPRCHMVHELDMDLVALGLSVEGHALVLEEERPVDD